MADLRELQIHGDVTPFLRPMDDVNDRLEEAHALLFIMERSFRYSDDAANLNTSMLADAMQGIATLVALAKHNLDNYDDKGWHAPEPVAA